MQHFIISERDSKILLKNGQERIADTWKTSGDEFIFHGWQEALAIHFMFETVTEISEIEKFSFLTKLCLSRWLPVGSRIVMSTEVVKARSAVGDVAERSSSYSCTSSSRCGYASWVWVARMRRGYAWGVSWRTRCLRSVSAVLRTACTSVDMTSRFTGKVSDKHKQNWPPIMDFIGIHIEGTFE